MAYKRRTAWIAIALVVFATMLVGVGTKQDRFAMEARSITVVDRVCDPMPAKMKTELATIDDEISKAKNDLKRKRATKRRDAILKRYEDNATTRLIGLELRVGSADAGVFYSSADPIAVVMSTAAAKAFAIGDQFAFVPKGEPKIKDKVPTYRTDNVRRMGRLSIDFGTLDAKGSGCAFPWRDADKPAKIEVDGIDVSQGVGASKVVSVRIRNASGFPVIADLRVKLTTTKGADVEEYRFLLTRPLPNKKEMDLMGYLPRDYSASDLVATVDATCVYESMDELPAKPSP